MVDWLVNTLEDWSCRPEHLLHQSSGSSNYEKGLHVVESLVKRRSMGTVKQVCSCCLQTKKNQHDVQDWYWGFTSAEGHVRRTWPWFSISFSEIRLWFVMFPPNSLGTVNRLHPNTYREALSVGENKLSCLKWSTDMVMIKSVLVVMMLLEFTL